MSNTGKSIRHEARGERGARGFTVAYAGLVAVLYLTPHTSSTMLVTQNAPVILTGRAWMKYIILPCHTPIFCIV